MRNLLVLSLLAVLSLFISGCVQGMPSQCASLPSDTYAGCVYRVAVLSQDPFKCYSIKETDLRKTCIKDSSDSAKKKKLESLRQEEQEAMVYGEKKQAVQLPSAPTPPVGVSPSQPEPIQPQQPAAPSTNATELDMQIYATAVGANDILFCEQISEGTIMQSCISQVARQQKNISMCDTLTLKDNIDLCKLYSQGESNK